LTCTATCVAESNPPCDFAAGGSRNAITGDSVRVIVNYTYSSFFPLLFGNSFNLSSTVQMVIE
jgi:hypothetical protein